MNETLLAIIYDILFIAILAIGLSIVVRLALRGINGELNKALSLLEEFDKYGSNISGEHGAGVGTGNRGSSSRGGDGDDGRERSGPHSSDVLYR